MKNKPRYIIGIDPGTHTGLAMWDREEKKLVYTQSIAIHKAIESIQATFKFEKHDDSEFLFRIEDARLRKWFGKSTKGKDQGAGSIKRDCSIWEDFMKDWGLNYEMVNPKNQITKLSSEQFNSLTGWEGKTNEHSRDAAMLCWEFV